MYQKYPFVIVLIVFVLLFMRAAMAEPAEIQNGEDFYTETYLSSHILYPGENRTYEILVTNVLNNTRVIEISNKGLFGTPSANTLTIDNYSKGSFSIMITVPKNATTGIYSERLELKDERTSKIIPYVIEIRYPLIAPQFFIEPISKVIYIGDAVRLKVTIIDEGKILKDGLQIKYLIKNIATNRVEYEESEKINAYGGVSFVKSLLFNKSIENTTYESAPYYIEFIADYGESTVTKQSDSFEIKKRLWDDKKTKTVFFVVLLIVVTSTSFYIRKWYNRKKKDAARYVFPVSYTLMPQKSERTFWIGNIAETKIKTFINPNDLCAHTIVAGSTGAGKSVTASLIAEEALMKGIPVVVFDPTAQWTGFVKKCADKNILARYKHFGLNPEDDPKPFRGLIKEVTSAKEYYDFKKLMNKGEITVFTLDKLNIEEFDEAITNIVQQIFEVHWEESSELKLLVVFDEVHRLLEKYGGGAKGGYHALERGAREFRKWGIGLLLCSQVTSDFKTAVSGNIMTEVQMQTKSMEDIDRIKEKYGPDYAKRIAAEEIGTGMVQNPKYNKGHPWFVNFRPCLHNPHKITDEELKLYDSYYKEIEHMELIVENLKAQNAKDAYDLELEIKLAKNSLKEGRFKMCELYLEGLRKIKSLLPHDKHI